MHSYWGVVAVCRKPPVTSSFVSWVYDGWKAAQPSMPVPFVHSSKSSTVTEEANCAGADNYTDLNFVQLRDILLLGHDSELGKLFWKWHQKRCAIHLLCTGEKWRRRSVHQEQYIKNNKSCLKQHVSKNTSWSTHHFIAVCPAGTGSNAKKRTGDEEDTFSYIQCCPASSAEVQKGSCPVPAPS